MAASENTTKAEDVNLALDREFIANFKGESDRLAEILGIFSPEVMTAGTTLYQVTVTGSLNNSKTDPSDLSGESGAVTLGSSSGSSYVEGDEVALSKYSVSKTALGTVSLMPYRKRTTAEAIQKAGYEAAVMRTDRKMASNVRGDIIADFFKGIAEGTGTAAGKTLQATLANMDAALADAMEARGDDASGGIVHFVNRQDAAAYLGAQPITTQTAFGMTYLESFLGVERVFMTNKVAKGTAWSTAVENIHIYGLDFSELSRAGISYTVESGGLVGVAHEPAMDHVSVDTHVMRGMYMFPEVKNYIVKGSIAGPQ